MSACPKIAATIWGPRFEPLRGSDETEVEKPAVGVRAHARLRPPLLFRARTRGLHAQTDARASGEVECGSRSTQAEPSRSTEVFATFVQQ